MRLLLHPQAGEELEQAAVWYEARVAGLGSDLLDEVSRWLETIPEMPSAWPRWPGAPALEPPIRRSPLRRFPFALAYQVFEGHTLVLACAHTSKRPFYWRSRAEPDASEETPG